MKKVISLFDIIGPVMIGPSSSHTAGAAKIGYEAYKLINEKPQEITIHLYNSFAKTGKGHKTDVALLGGCIGILPHNKNLINSESIAKRSSIKYSINWHNHFTSKYHPNTAVISIKSKNRSVDLTGYSIGGGRISIVEVNGVKQEAGKSGSSSHYFEFGEFKNSYKNNSLLFEKIVAIEILASRNHFEQQTKIFKNYWKVMKEGIIEGLKHTRRSKDKMFGGDGSDLFKSKKALGSNIQNKSVAFAIALAEYNAYMGKIVATPTAGSSGILPGVFYSLNKYYHVPEKKIIEGLFIAGMVGAVCANKFDLAGAVAGCQAEIGVAGAMSAAAGAYMLGGEIKEIESAASLVLANLLGLTCDPVNGKVEVPCILRNGIVASMTISSIEMAMNGVLYPIPLDEVIEVAGKTGKMIPACLRETSLAGLAITPTALEISN